MTEEQRQAALSTIENIRNGIGTIIGKDVMDTIYEALQAPQPEVVTVEELSQEYVDAVYAAFPNADLNRHSAISQDFLHFISRFKPHGIRIIREKSE